MGLVTDETWTADERAAARAFLQRAEVRLSTIHRVVTALLSGAGLMVLLPAIARDAVTSVLRALVAADPNTERYLLAAATATVLALPLIAFVLLLRDITGFYFHGQHFDTPNGQIFTPRFTLTGLRLPADELSDLSHEQLNAARATPDAVELLVPGKDDARTRIDRQLDAYGGLGRNEHGGDAGRAEALFSLVATRERHLAAEVAKVEHGLARHLLRVQVIVLRYVKALLLFLVTTLAVFAANATVEHDPTIGAPTTIWLAIIYLAWATAVVTAAGDPVRTIERLLRSEGATRTAVGADVGFTQVERVAVGVASIGFGLALASLVPSLTRAGLGGSTQVLGLTCAVVGAGAYAVALWRWSTRQRRA